MMDVVVSSSAQQKTTCVYSKSSSSNSRKVKILTLKTMKMTVNQRWTANLKTIKKISKLTSMMRSLNARLTI